MKIIKEGKIKITERYKKCPSCNCEFIYDKKKDFVAGTIDGFELYDCVKCPTCGLLLQMSFFDRKVRDKKCN